MTPSASGRVSYIGRSPRIRAGIVSPASIRITGAGPVAAAPNDHFAAGPDCRVTDSAGGRVGYVGDCPSICAGIVSPAGVKFVVTIISTPDDHFTAGPDCRVTPSASGRVGRASGCPAICVGIVSPAGVEKAAVTAAAPNDHFTAGPDCRVTVPGRGRVGRAGGCPTICVGIVSAPGVLGLVTMVVKYRPR